MVSTPRPSPIYCFPILLELIENFQPGCYRRYVIINFPCIAILRKDEAVVLIITYLLLHLTTECCVRLTQQPAKYRLYTDLRIFACEQQVLSWADKVFAPSRWAAVKVERMLKSEQNILMVPEPYKADKADSWRVRDNFNGHNFAYFGRLSFAKGLDRSANFLSGIVERLAYLRHFIRWSRG